jgi:3-methyladenine DNA glycosylase AlkD
MMKAVKTRLQASEAAAVSSELRALSNPEKAKILSRFFKTGAGEYGAGDRFLGVVMPDVRRVMKAHRQASSNDILRLLHSPYHEERMTALLILVEQYRRGDDSRRQAIYDLYLANTSWINNWDLVDLTAQHIVGRHLFGKDTSILQRLAFSKKLWERRIAVLSTFHFIGRGDSREALYIAELLLHDSHDLIHKAVGWMLREVGKRCSMEAECRFLDAHAAVMPRTMLRYAIERFPDPLKSEYMRMKAVSKETPNESL